MKKLFLATLWIHTFIFCVGYDVYDCALYVVYLVNLNFKDRYSVDASADIHIAIHIAYTVARIMGYHNYLFEYTKL